MLTVVVKVLPAVSNNCPITVPDIVIGLTGVLVELRVMVPFTDIEHGVGPGFLSWGKQARVRVTDRFVVRVPVGAEGLWANAYPKADSESAITTNMMNTVRDAFLYDADTYLIPDFNPMLTTLLADDGQFCSLGLLLWRGAFRYLLHMFQFFFYCLSCKRANVSVGCRSLDGVHCPFSDSDRSPP